MTATASIVKRRDEGRYDQYRTKTLTLDVCRCMRDAIDTGNPYESILDPQPADSHVAHPPRKEMREASHA